MKKKSVINNNGFTLLELLIALAIFSLIIGVGSSLFISALRAQRKSLALRELLDQTSYVLEYMNRALRMAKKELGDPPTCLTNCGRGCNYETNPPQNKIKFIDSKGVCTEFIFEDEKVKKRIGSDTWELTSDRLTVETFNVEISGQNQEDDFQPRINIYLAIKGTVAGAGEPPRIEIQTTISQRNLDVKY